MRLISDVHGAFGALRRVGQESNEPLLILGDLVNFVDYRTGDGMVADVFGHDFVRQVAALRARGDYAGSRSLWIEKSEELQTDIRTLMKEKLLEQYAEVTRALEGANAYVTFGNVDTPSILEASLPDGVRYADGEVLEIEGWKVGFAGGGGSTPLATPGEVTDEEMRAKLDQLGPVDILCSHLPPAIDPLRFDVIVGRREAGSQPILDYLRNYRPPFHYFGDVHQPRAARWQVGETFCQNVGYFRATKRAIHHPARV